LYVHHHIDIHLLICRFAEIHKSISSFPFSLITLWSIKIRVDPPGIGLGVDHSWPSHFQHNLGGFLFSLKLRPDFMSNTTLYCKSPTYAIQYLY